MGLRDWWRLLLTASPLAENLCCPRAEGVDEGGVAVKLPRDEGALNGVTIVLQMRAGVPVSALQHQILVVSRVQKPAKQLKKSMSK